MFLYNIHMSILSKNITGNRIALLAKTGHAVFHVDDLALIFGIRRAHTLRVTISRYAQSGLLHRLQRGMYSLLPPEKIDPRAIGVAGLHRFCYVSTETVLHDEGFILQSMDAVTFVSGVSRRFVLFGHRFVSRRLQERYLHHPASIAEKNGILTASPERAIADLLFFDPWYHFDRPVAWDAVRALQQEIGYPLTPHRYVDSA